MMSKVLLALYGYFLVDTIYSLAQETLFLEFETRDITECAGTVNRRYLDTNTVSTYIGTPMRLIFASKEYINQIICVCNQRYVVINFSVPAIRNISEIKLPLVAEKNHEGHWNCSIYTNHQNVVLLDNMCTFTYARADCIFLMNVADPSTTPRLTTLSSTSAYVGHNDATTPTTELSPGELRQEITTPRPSPPPVDHDHNETTTQLKGVTKISRETWIFAGVALILTAVIATQTVVILCSKAKARRERQLEEIVRNRPRQPLPTDIYEEPQELPRRPMRPIPPFQTDNLKKATLGLTPPPQMPVAPRPKPGRCVLLKPSAI